MSLPSQSGRSGGFRTARFSVSRRYRRRRFGQLVPVVVLGLLVAGVWYFWPGGGEENDAAAVAVGAEAAGGGSGDGVEEAMGSAAGERADRNRPFARQRGGEAAGGGSASEAQGAPTLSMGESAEGSGVVERGVGGGGPIARPVEEAERRPVDEVVERDGGSGAGEGVGGGREEISGSSPVSALVAEARGALQDGRVVRARDALNRALHHPDALPGDRRLIRERLADIARELTFSGRVVEGDPIAREYVVRPGDSLSRIANREGTELDWRFIQRVNGIDRPSSLRVGQRIKLVQGPFHAVVSKTDYRLDLYADALDADGNRIFLRSLPVGLGEYDSTPVGNWIVKNRDDNPGWVNPRDRSERYGPDDPENPIGEYWIGLEGTDPENADEWGIGIHGTIEPESIGTQASMGCVRMLPDDIRLMFETLLPGESVVVIVE